MKTKPLFLAALCAVSTIANAQFHELKADVGALLASSAGLAYEYAWSPQMGANLRLGYFNSDNLLSLSSYQYTAFTATTDFRYYLKPEQGADRHFASAYLKYRSSQGTVKIEEQNLNTGLTEVSEYSQNAQGMAIGLTYGQKFVTKSGFTFEYYGGLGRYLFVNRTYTPDTENEAEAENEAKLPSFDFRMGLILGWRF